MSMQKLAIFLTLFFAMISLSRANCPSQSIDFSNNFILNGNFSGGLLAPWSAHNPQVGLGTNYNSNWPPSTMVAALDSGQNQKYKQTMVLAPGTFYFFLNFANQQNSNANTNGMRIYWNGRNVLNQPSPQNNLIFSQTLTLIANDGPNQIIIEGKGKDDSEGTTITNIGIYPMTLYHRVMVNGICSCKPGYFDNGYNYPCVACNLIVSLCTSCNFIPNISLLSSSCLSNITSGQNCTFGNFQCLSCQQGYFPAGSQCSQIQINPQFYEPLWNIRYKSCNSFTAQFFIALLQYQILIDIQTNNSGLAISKYKVEQKIGDNYKISIHAIYTKNIPDEVVAFIVNYQKLTGQVSKQSTIIKMEASNIPLIHYASETCEKANSFESLSTAIVVMSYTTMIISLFSFKIVGLQLSGVLQLAFFALPTHQKFNVYLDPIAKWRYMNGLNLNSQTPLTNVSNQINHIGYRDSFFQNINLMYGILLLDLILGWILEKIGNKRNIEKLIIVSKYMKTQIFITIFLFNSLNISFSIGLHFKYANASSTHLYWLSTIGAISGIALYIYAIVLMQVGPEREFGQYKYKFKKNCITKFYIPSLILYRFILGIYIAAENQWHLGTLIILLCTIFYLIYLLANLSFKHTYQNYRSLFCNITQLVILLVANYYRSIKYNNSTQQKAQLFAPAILQLIFIFATAITSMICLAYEIWIVIHSYLRKRKRIQGEEKSKRIQGEDKSKRIQGEDKNKTDEHEAINVDNQGNIRTNNEVNVSENDIIIEEGQKQY